MKKFYFITKLKSSTIQTLTVGFGISPNLLYSIINQSYKIRLADFTAGMEFHLAPKI